MNAERLILNRFFNEQQNAAVVASANSTSLSEVGAVRGNLHLNAVGDECCGSPMRPGIRRSHGHGLLRRFPLLALLFHIIISTAARDIPASTLATPPG